MGKHRFSGEAIKRELRLLNEGRAERGAGLTARISAARVQLKNNDSSDMGRPVPLAKTDGTIALADAYGNAVIRLKAVKALQSEAERAESTSRGVETRREQRAAKAAEPAPPPAPTRAARILGPRSVAPPSVFDPSVAGELPQLASAGSRRARPQSPAPAAAAEGRRSKRRRAE